MAYNPQIKADSEIFEKIRFISVDERYILKPIMPEIIENEAMFYKINSGDERMKKYLPAYYADDSETSEKHLHDLIQRSLFRQSILYCIRDKNQPFPIGYLNIISPLSPTGLNDWSVDFWMGKIAEGKGHMSASLNKLLDYMATMKIETVKALVDKDNIRSINVLEKVGFQMLNIEKGGLRLLMSVNIKDRI
jgi:RimJ/RimL family protein N-acetyltransferase